MKVFVILVLVIGLVLAPALWALIVSGVPQTDCNDECSE